MIYAAAEELIPESQEDKKHSDVSTVGVTLRSGGGRKDIKKA
jgi:hypothetical protein